MYACLYVCVCCCVYVCMCECMCVCCMCVSLCDIAVFVSVCFVCFCVCMSVCLCVNVCMQFHTMLFHSKMTIKTMTISLRKKMELGQMKGSPGKATCLPTNPQCTPLSHSGPYSLQNSLWMKVPKSQTLFTAGIWSKMKILPKGPRNDKKA